MHQCLTGEVDPAPAERSPDKWIARATTPRPSGRAAAAVAFSTKPFLCAAQSETRLGGYRPGRLWPEPSPRIRASAPPVTRIRLSTTAGSGASTRTEPTQRTIPTTHAATPSSRQVTFPGLGSPPWARDETTDQRGLDSSNATPRNPTHTNASIRLGTDREVADPARRCWGRVWGRMSEAGADSGRSASRSWPVRERRPERILYHNDRVRDVGVAVDG